MRLGLRTEVGFVRRLPVQRLMRVAAVVQVETLGQALFLLDAVLTGTQIDPFVLYRPPQTLDKDVVMTTPAFVYADLDAVRPTRPPSQLAP